MSATVKQLREWLETLPPEMDDAPVQSIVHGYPSGSKRVIAFKYKDGSGVGLCVNSMGTHGTNDFGKSIETVGVGAGWVWKLWRRH